MLFYILFVLFWGCLTAGLIAVVQHRHPERFTPEAVAQKWARFEAQEQSDE